VSLPYGCFDVTRPALVFILSSAIALVGATTARAQTVTATRAVREGLRLPSVWPVTQGQPLAATQPPSIYDRIWRFAEWYRNDKARVIQRIQFAGRYQHDYALVESDQGDTDEWNIRRMRLGARVTMFRTWLFHAEVDLNPQEQDPLYVRLTDFYLQWSRNPRVVITGGKQGVPFTSEGATSSRELVAIDLKLGKFNTLVGSEVNEPWLNPNWSRQLVYSLAQPAQSA
jgi:phosphate-selective porin